MSRPGLSVGKTGARLILREQRKNVMECHFRKIRHLSIASRGVSLSSDLVFACSEQHISITFYGHKGHPEAVLHSPMHPLGEVSVQQLKMYETPRALELVKKLLTGKSKNQVNLIKFYLRHRKEAHPEFARRAEDNLQSMEQLLQDLAGLAWEEPYAITRDRLFMVEARISGHYWDTVKMLAPPELEFSKRQRQNAPDVVNNMLNYGYGILYQRVWRVVL